MSSKVLAKQLLFALLAVLVTQARLAAASPVISKVANAEGEAAVIAPNTWVEVKGSNLAPAGDTRIWQTSDFVKGQMPASLDGVSVTVNGKSAFVYYISPSQINILTPPDAMSGSVQVAVNNNGATASATAQAATMSPSFFVFSDGQHVAAVHLNGTLVGASSLSVPGYPFAPAQPGETVEIFANGFGSTSTAVVSGSSTQSGTLSPNPTVTIGGVQAPVNFAGLISPGLFQFNVLVPLNAPGGDEAIVATFNGQTTQAGTLLTLTGTAPPTSVTFFVASNGNDSWSGTLAAPNSSSTDGPFATFDHARAAVQALNKNGLKQISVQFRAGTYDLPATVNFTSADSGSANLSIVYQNYPGETPVLSGGMRVTGWTNTSANTWKTTLPASTRYFENLFYNDVRRLRPRLGSSAGNNLGTYYRVAATVYLNAPGPPAAAPDPNCSIYVDGSGWECFDRFQYAATDPISGAWKNLAPAAGNLCGQPAGSAPLAGNVELIIFEKFETARMRISCVDTAKRIVYLTGPTLVNAGFYTALGYIPSHRYLVENIEDSLGPPGQWFLDQSATPWTLTYLANAGENPNSDTVVIPQTAQLLVGSNLQYVTFRGLAFEHDNHTVPAVGEDPDVRLDVSAAVSFQNSQYITFDSGVVAHTSGSGLDFTTCDNATASPSWCVSTSTTAVTANNAVQNSAFYDIGATAVRVGLPGNADYSEANVPQFTTVANNVVEGYGRVFPGSYGITQGDGHNNTYTHNDVYDGYRAAVGIGFLSGYTSHTHDNVISFNHVYNLMQGIMNDDGSLYINALNELAPVPQGNKILNNKVHDVSDASALDSDGYGGDGLYIDNTTGAVDVENNLVYRVSGSGMSFARSPGAANQPSTIKNNIFAFARTAMVQTYDPYPFGVPTSVNQIFTLSNNLFYFDRTAASSPQFFVQGGCTYSGGFAFTAWQPFASNLYWRTDGGFATDPQAFHQQPAEVSAGNLCFGAGAQSKWVSYTFANWQKFGEDPQSVVQNPGFTNPAYPADDFSLTKGSPGVGFVAFDPSQAGRSNPVINPPAVPATFPTKTFNPATDF